MDVSDSFQIIAVFHVIVSVCGFIVGTCIMTFALINLDSHFEVALIAVAAFIMIISVVYFLLFAFGYICSNCSSRFLMFVWYCYSLFTLSIILLDFVSIVYLIVLVCSVRRASSLLVSNIILLIFFFVKLCLCFFHIKSMSVWYKTEPEVRIVSEAGPPTYQEVCHQPDSPLPPAYEIIVDIEITNTSVVV